MSAGVVEVRRDGGGFRVVLNPPDPAHPPRSFDEQREAFGYAGAFASCSGGAKSI